MTLTRFIQNNKSTFSYFFLSSCKVNNPPSVIKIHILNFKQGLTAFELRLNWHPKDALLLCC